MRHLVVYRNPDEYNMTPCIARLQNGDLLVGFRRAGLTSARAARAGKHTHIDPKSQAVALRSADGGERWDPATMTVLHPIRPTYGMQDPSLAQLQSGTVVSAFFGWQAVPVDQKDSLDYTVGRDGSPLDWLGWAASTVGAFTVHSSDGGRTWEKALTRIEIPDIPHPENYSVRQPAVELPDGTLVLPIMVHAWEPRFHYWSHLARSHDQGRTWGESSVLARDEEGRLSFGEVAVLHLGEGRMLAMARVEHAQGRGYGYLYQCESDDQGYTWTPPRPTPIWGHPAHLLRLQDGRILCAYGHRREPFGVRACLSRDEGRTWDVEHEVVLRADGLGRDLGYPSSTQMDDGTILTVYYMHDQETVRYIAGTFWRA